MFAFLVSLVFHGAFTVGDVGVPEVTEEGDYLS